MLHTYMLHTYPCMYVCVCAAFIRVGKLEMTSYTTKDEAAPPTKSFTYSLTKIKSWKLGGRVTLVIKLHPLTDL